MTAITTTAAPTTYTNKTRTSPTWRTGARAAVLAAVATTAVAAVAKAAGVPLEVDSEPIPLLGFAQMTLLCSVIGFLLAKALARWAATPRRTFTVVTVALTVLTFVPDLMVSASMATRVVLIATHVAAAAIVIPTFAGRLPDRRSA